MTVTDQNDSSVTGKTADGQTLRLPLTAVDGTPKIGQELKLIAVLPGSEDAGKTELARSLLNALLEAKP